MHFFKSSSMPRFWWAFPWSHARALHSAAVALKRYADRADRALFIQDAIIRDQSQEIATLRRRVSDLHDSIVAGRALIPDAEPIDELDDHA